ncbi:lymphocyte-specific protein 1 isoform X2 [Bombina bombina]|uniref:lymphocyte-specific protein 1 isoform X2 n=1 Tax=Bombina bombina TaxID=8345 RepID=UPI00235B0BF0|nr:lymphocyte-specific protein 1 isoform X2 [Bombina bombina]
MSTSILRRNSSKKRIHDLLRLTTQWSVEDEEEAARERRRRERQTQYPTGDDEQAVDGLSEEPSTQPASQAELKPMRTLESEEDEGFGDWSQRLEQRKQMEAYQVHTEETEGHRVVEEEANEMGKKEEEREGAEIQESHVEEEEDEGTSRSEVTEPQFETNSPEPCTNEEIPSHQWSTSTREYEEGQVEEEEREEQREEAEEKITERGWEDSGDQQVQRQQWVTEEEHIRRRSVSSEGEETDDRITVTVKITERAECLNRSIQKSNSIKKSEPPLLISKIDDRLEQYTHAIETSTKQGRLVRQPSLELLSPGDAVASKKNLWESGEVTAASKAQSCKDTEGINVAVSDLINQWGKEKSETDGPQSPTKLTEVRPGDVLSKKSLWEQNAMSSPTGKNSAASKKYKFVPTGHGKYERILVDDP